VDTLKELLTESAAAGPDKVLFQYKERGAWRRLSYAEFLARVRDVSELLARLGVEPKVRVALCAENSVAWPALYFGAVALGATVVPVDARLKQQETTHILRDSACSVLLTTARQYQLVQDIERMLPELRHVVLLEGSRILPVDSRGVQYHDFETALTEAVQQADAANRAFDRHDPLPADVASFIYTSGTTGRQKGAMLTHGNFLANVAGCRKAFAIHPNENFLLVLPLHHAFAFTGNLLLPMACGNCISLVENLRTVGENMREVSPTAFIGVPLLIEKMYQRILARLRKRRMVYALFRMGLRGPVRRQIRASLGGRLRIVVTGGAPCDPAVLHGFRQLGIDILEGYGLTEASPVVALNPLARPKPGSIGLPLDGVEVRLYDVNAQGVGELQIRGPNVMLGYYNDPAATEEAFLDGWFRTGDLARRDEDGYLHLAGRKKSLIVNREGKNIYPEEVELQALRSPFLLEALVLGYREPGDGPGERVGIVVVPNQDALDEEARRRGQPLRDADVVELLRGEVKCVCAEIADYKRPRKILIRVEEFEKTSTGKIKRYLYDLEGAEL
jgi:long-chain acyl-CoA synthetase